MSDVVTKVVTRKTYFWIKNATVSNDFNDTLVNKTGGGVSNLKIKRLYHPTTFLMRQETNNRKYCFYDYLNIFKKTKFFSIRKRGKHGCS